MNIILFSDYYYYFLFDDILAPFGILLLLIMYFFYLRRKYKRKHNLSNEDQIVDSKYNEELISENSKLFIDKNKFTTLFKVVRWNAVLLVILGIVGIIIIYNKRPIPIEKPKATNHYYFSNEKEQLRQAKENDNK